MRQVTVRQPCSAPVETVWQVATDLAHASSAIEGIRSTQLLTDGPFGVGTRWRETRTMFGREATEEMEITAVDPGRSYTALAESSGMRYTTTWELVPAGDGTEIVMRFSGEPINRLSRLMSPLTGLMASSVEKAMRTDMADLARAAESRH
jgi:hypothetical protein